MIPPIAANVGNYVMLDKYAVMESVPQVQVLHIAIARPEIHPTTPPIVASAVKYVMSVKYAIMAPAPQVQDQRFAMEHPSIHP